MFELVKQLLVEELSLDEDSVKPEAELQNDLGINSIELADLVMLCEDKFGVEVQEEDIPRFRTVQDVSDYLKEHGAKED